MSTPIASQHPAVVLRSHYVHMRALLAAALVAVVGLAAAVVILATTNSTTITTKVTPAAPVTARLGSGGQELAPFGLSPQQTRRESRPDTRLDGGPEEGTRGAQSNSIASHFGTRLDGGPEEGTAGH
ncbi:hypothetical protein [Capillimicrobium parvum]|uniref:Uncharacterized protein n=1 Tax=Capillimicrobium parvum TaxID=2884022 RepID=A0A9E7BXQ8_9ACTN|nr:hypothetical protein [Capillimicrobium parvum]UGS34020.1 hypothetical protein DSM104329_00390 [Capillimicrobium parvum]